MKICDRCGEKAEYSIHDVTAECTKVAYRLFDTVTAVDVCKRCMEILSDTVKQILSSKATGVNL